MPHRYRVLLIVSAATFVSSLDLFIVNIAFPSIQRDFAGTTDAQLSWVLNVYAIVTAALLVPAGRIADLLGRKRLFMAGLLLFVGASALCGASPGPLWLISARALQAAGAAILLPTSLALLLTDFPARQRAFAVAIWSATGAVAAAAGPPVGGLLVQSSWRWVFLVNLPVGAVTALVALRTLRESKDPAGGRLPDLAGAGLLALAAGALMLAIVEGPGWGWSDPRVLGLFAGAVLLLVGFGVRSASHPVPVIEMDLLRARSFVAANVAGLIFFAAFGAMLLSSVLFLTRVWHQDILTAGLEVTPGPAMAALAAVPGGLLARRVGLRQVAVLGALLYSGGGLWWLTHISVEPHYLRDFLPGMLIGGTGVGLVIPTLAGATAASLPAARFATGSGVYGMSRQFGIALGVALLIAVLGSAAPGRPLDGFRLGWDLIVIGALLSALAAAAIGRTAPGPEPARTESEAVAAEGLAP
jgi:EmrB/QacA subfamily drug resistance transporter